MRASRPLVDRLMERVRVLDSGCWEWTGSLDEYGYGCFKAGPGRPRRSHRLMYEEVIGPIPEGLHLDHTCHSFSSCAAAGNCLHRRCVNPAHLEPVTALVNTWRGRTNATKTKCKNGHVFSAGNTYQDARGFRACRTCHAESQARYRQRRQVAA